MTYTLIYDDYQATYTIKVTDLYNGLPSILIDTNDVPIVSKDDYVDATITIFDTDESLRLSTTEVNIKGRGNSTWNMPKKPYRLKFDSKEALGGFPRGCCLQTTQTRVHYAHLSPLLCLS
ncbi:MAG: hypothetical protein SNJ09_06030 [Rikenellaceae bacterium]